MGQNKFCLFIFFFVQDNVKNRQEKFNILAKLCDVGVMSIRQMTAAEAIEKTCA